MMLTLHQPPHAVVPISPVEHVQAEILSIFDHLERRQASSRAKASAKKRLAARRAIEQHFERKALEATLRDSWDDEV